MSDDLNKLEILSDEEVAESLQNAWEKIQQETPKYGSLRPGPPCPICGSPTEEMFQPPHRESWAQPTYGGRLDGESTYGYVWLTTHTLSHCVKRLAERVIQLEAENSVRRGLDQAARGEFKYLGSFEKYVDLEEGDADEPKRD